MTPEESADRYHKLAVKLFALHATNPAAKYLGLPGGSIGDIDDANSLCQYINQVKSERRARNAVRRCRAAKRHLRPVRRVSSKRKRP